MLIACIDSSPRPCFLREPYSVTMSFSDPRSRYAQRIVVTETHVDELGHVNNVVYLQLIEDLTRAHATHVGMGLEAMRAAGAVPVARKHVIQYHRPAQLGDELEVFTQIAYAKGLRAGRHNEVRLARDGTLLVEIDSDWVWVDPLRLRPRVVPHEILEAFGTTEMTGEG